MHFMASSSPKSWFWRGGKLVLGLVILVFVGRQFHRDLMEFDPGSLTLRFEWLTASVVFYLFGMACSGTYWHHLLALFGNRLSFYAALRAYFISQLGKYFPGKAWALLLRANLVRPFGVRFGISVTTSFYEVLTTMAAGALVAALLFIVNPPEIPGLSWPPALTGLILVGICGVPLLPWVFNFVVERMAKNISYVYSLSIPRLGYWPLLKGLAITAIGWVLLGLSTSCLLVAVLPDVTLTVELFLRSTAGMGFAYVAGFLAIFMPSGFGVREYFLRSLLAFAGPVPQVAAAILLLRLLWTGAEILLAPILYFVPPTITTPTLDRPESGAIPIRLESPPPTATPPAP